MDQVLDEIGVADERRAFFYFSDARLQPAEPSRGRRGLRVVNAARLNWRRPLPEGFSSQDHKGTDVLLRGAAAFLAGGGHLTLSLFRKGIDVAATESLVADLGLSGVVEWHDEMDLHRFHGVLADADVVCDQLGDAFPGMAMLDAMALGRPVIANLPAALTAGRYPEPWPVRQASTVEDVTAHLAALADDEVRVEAARQTAAFATRHLSAVAAARICVRHFHESAPCREEKAS
jgi:glycosyltransferase involved in cell wall biosynthesis